MILDDVLEQHQTCFNLSVDKVKTNARQAFVRIPQLNGIDSLFSLWFQMYVENSQPHGPLSTSMRFFAQTPHEGLQRPDQTGHHGPHKQKLAQKLQIPKLSVCGDDQNTIAKSITAQHQH